jgi:hypothetical protein
MNTYRAGIQRVLAFYLSGIFVALAFHLLTGWENKYAPPMSVIVLALLLVCGLPWMTLNMLALVRKTCSAKTLGELTAHFVIYAASMTIVLWQIR